MKIIMICGSPRRERSTSYYLLQVVKIRLRQGNDINIYPMKAYREYHSITYDMLDADIIILAFPLYVDGIPGSFLSTLQNIERVMKNIKLNTGIDSKIQTRVYTMINNGFYDAKQNENSISMIRKWCDKCGFQKGSAIGLGAGGMIKMFPIGRRPSVNLTRALKQFTRDIRKRKCGDDIFVEPNFPREIYMLVAHINWKVSAIKNGVKVRELRKR